MTLQTYNAVSERRIIPTVNVYTRKEPNLTQVITELIGQGLSFESIVAVLQDKGVEESDLTEEQRKLLNKVAKLDGVPQLEPQKVTPPVGTNSDTSTKTESTTSKDKEESKDPDLAKAIKEEKKKQELDYAMEEALNKQEFFTRMTKLVSGMLIVISVAYFLTKK